jgi:uncharacterized membrane protein YeaQ/YmgE (transglycosylase-associated protein family)
VQNRKVLESGVPALLLFFNRFNAVAETGGNDMIQFFVGAFVGAAVVVFIMALIYAAVDDDGREE